MKHLLLVAHGSRRQQSNDEVQALATLMSAKVGSSFQRVAAAFLELAQPSIPEGIDTCIRLGAKEVIVLPYFLSAGRHVSEDVPKLVQQKQQQYPEIAIHLANYLGAADGIVDILLQDAEKTVCARCNAEQVCEYPLCLNG